MKKFIAILLSGTLVVSTITSCFAADNDEWKNNTGTIDLDEMSVTGTGIEVNGNTILISQGGDFTVTGAQSDGMIRVNTEDKVKLRLSGMSLTNTTGPAIFFENTEKGFITVTEGTENFLADSSQYSVDGADAALFSNDDLEIKGDGTLTVEGNYKHGIASDDDLSVENGVIEIKSAEHGLKANNAVNIIGGTLDITAETGKGIKAGETLTVDSGTINIVSEQSEGMESKGTIVINGGDINITAADDGINTGYENTQTDETMEMGDRFKQDENGDRSDRSSDGMPQGGQRQKTGGGTAQNNSSEMSIGEINRGVRPAMQNGEEPQGNPPELPDGETPQGNPPELPNGEAPQGNPPELPNGETPQGSFPEMQGGGMQGGGFGEVDEETAAAHAITINGGNICLSVGGDGIDSNGNLTITGGKIAVDGPESSGDGPFDSQGTISITGGEIITVSSAGMIQLPQSSEQNILKVFFDGQGVSGDKIAIKDSDNNEVMTHTASCRYSALVYSSSELTTGESYSVYINDELKETVVISDGITSAGTAQGQTQGQMPGGGRFNGEGSRQQRDSGITVSLDGQNISFDTNPVIKNDTTLVGFRAILEALGAEVSWDGETQTVTAKKDDISIVLKINSTTATVNGEEKTLPTAPEIINDSTMIPVRFISEQLGMNVDWDENARSVSIASK